MNLLLGSGVGVNQTVAKEGGTTTIPIAAFTLIGRIEWFPISWTIKVLGTALDSRFIKGYQRTG